MSQDAVTVDVDAEPDKVWAVVGDFGGVSWFPGIESARLEGDVRVLGMMGMEVRERLSAKDDAARSLTYGIVGGVPVESHRATVTVEPAGSGSRVTWSVAVEPDSMLPVMVDVYRQALEALRQQVT